MSAEHQPTDPDAAERDAKAGPLFFMWARNAVRLMREDGMNEVRIACVVTEIRSAALHEERLRVARLTESNPPSHVPWPNMQKALSDV